MINFNNGTLRVQGHWLKPTNGPVPPDPYNPLGLPSYTMRLKYRQGDTPTPRESVPAESYTLVDAEENIWDYKYENPNWSYALTNQRESTGPSLIAVLGANTTNVTDMSFLFTYDEELTICNIFDTSNVSEMTRMFSGCYTLSSIPLFDTSNVTNMAGMCGRCYALTTVPLFDTSKVTNVNQMLWSCNNVESGALALYNQLSTQTTPPSNHSQTFYNCGSNTTSGAAELAQIPSDWK